VGTSRNTHTHTHRPLLNAFSVSCSRYVDNNRLRRCTDYA
jgi:hypothetical protein